MAEEELSLEEMLICFIGCKRIPKSLEGGILVVDLESEQHSFINTCAPSITFTGLNKQAYKVFNLFKELMVTLILGDSGFGLS